MVTVAHTCGLRRGRARSCPACQAADKDRLLALSAERDRAEAYAEARWREGFAVALAGNQGYTGTDLLDAYAAGARAAYASRASAFDAGWAACLDRFAEQIGGRNSRAHPTGIELVRWTRHSPDCTSRGGDRPCRQAGCRPGRSKDFGKPAPWDETGAQLRSRVQESWARWEAEQPWARRVS